MASGRDVTTMKGIGADSFEQAVLILADMINILPQNQQFINGLRAAGLVV